jgi:hypothetical protein
MSNEQQPKNDLTAKKLPCGGYAIYGMDTKTKSKTQIGYVGPNLSVEAYLKDVKIEK